MRADVVADAIRPVNVNSYRLRFTLQVVEKTLGDAYVCGFSQCHHHCAVCTRRSPLWALKRKTALRDSFVGTLANEKGCCS